MIFNDFILVNVKKGAILSCDARDYVQYRTGRMGALGKVGGLCLERVREVTKAIIHALQQKNRVTVCPGRGGRVFLSIHRYCRVLQLSQAGGKSISISIVSEMKNEKGFAMVVSCFF